MDTLRSPHGRFTRRQAPTTYGSSQGTTSTTTTGDSQSQSQNTSSTNNTSVSLSSAAIPPVKRVRIDVNGVQAVPGADSTATELETDGDDATEVDSDGGTDGRGRRKGRGKVLSDAEFQARIKERNRQAAANARRTQRNELNVSRSKVALLEKDVEELKTKLGSLQR